MRHSFGLAGLLAIAAACSDGTAPESADASITVLYSDSSSRSSMVRTGQLPTVVPQLDTTTIFAPMSSGVVTFSRSRLSIYRFSEEALTPLGNRVETGGIITTGAISRDGRRLAYATAVGSDRFLHIADLTDGTRDSINVAGREDLGAADQIVYSVPIWSPSGDSVAFLLPNILGMQMLIFERSSRRVEQKVVMVPTSTYFQLQQGRPHWASDGTIRVLARRTELEPYRVLDTLVVLKIYAREAMPRTEVVSRATPPDTMTMGALWSYSFSADSKTVAFGMSSGGKAAIMVMRQGKPKLQTMLFGAGVRPRDIVIIP